jgi:hypothetical protein
LIRKWVIIILLLTMLFTGIILYFSNMVSFHLMIFIILGSIVLVVLNTMEIEEVKKKEAEKHLKAGEDLYNRNELNNALKSFSKALKLQPDCYEALLGTAQCYRMKMETDLAQGEYKKAIEMDPKRHEAYFFLGMVEFQANRPEEALVSLKKAESLKPDLEDLQYFLGEIHQKLGKIGEAVKYYEKYMECCVGCRMRDIVMQKLRSFEPGPEAEEEKGGDAAPGDEASAEGAGEAEKTQKPRPPARKFQSLVDEPMKQPVMLNLKVEIGKSQPKIENVVTPGQVEEEDRRVSLNLSMDGAGMEKVMAALEQKRKEKTGELKNN